jgi:hypothetical protein
MLPMVSFIRLGWRVLACSLVKQPVIGNAGWTEAFNVSDVQQWGSTPPVINQEENHDQSTTSAAVDRNA